MKKLLFLLTVILGIALMSSCSKEYEFNNNIPENPNTFGKVKLLYYDGSKNPKGEIVSGSTIHTNSTYPTRFTMVYDGDTIPVGVYRIAKNNLVVHETDTVNGTIYHFSDGTYMLNVLGLNIPNQSFENITIIAGIPTPPPSNEETFPIRLYNLNVGAQNVTLSVRANITQWGNITSNQFFHVKRINSLNFESSQAITKVNDSLFFTITFPKINSTFIEFNAGYFLNDTTPKWLTPSYGNPPSILYNGTGIPYSDSHSYFSFRLIQNGNDWEIRTHSGTLILTTGSGSSQQIPGDHGDGIANNYQVRWFGENIYIKTTLATTLRYKKEGDVNWTYVPLLLALNPTFKTCIQGNNGSYDPKYTQWGTGTNDSNFIPFNNEMNMSAYARPMPDGSGIAIIVNSKK